MRGEILNLAAIAATTLVLAPSSESSSLQTLTIQDSIEATQILDPPVTWAKYKSLDFNTSPDGQLIAIVVRRGDTVTGLNHYSLRLYKERDILESVSKAKGRLARYETAVEFSNASWKHAIEQVTWAPDSKRLAFIGRDASSTGQVFSYDVGQHRIDTLTQHPTDILTYDFSWSQRAIVFSAYSPDDWTDRNDHGYRVRSGYALEMCSATQPESVQAIGRYVANLAAGTVIPIKMPSSVTPRHVKISPSGKWAVGLGQVRSVPRRWSEYEFIDQSDIIDTSSQSPSDDAESVGEYDDAFGNPAPWIQQYYILNLLTGDARPLIDAPAITLGMLAEPVWSGDERSIFLPSTYVPAAETSTSDDEARRLQHRAVVEVDRSTGQIERIADQPERTADGRRSRIWSGIDLLGDGSILVRERDVDHQQDSAVRYEKSSGTWIESGKRSLPGVRPSKRLTLSVVQDMNTPPEIFAHDAQTRRSRAITDLNPILRQRSLGKVITFDWSDRLGRTFRGGLVLPPNYDPSRRYPIVVQTYGFRSEEFLLDGPNGITTAYAARALANKRMLVLQAPALHSANGTGANTSFDERSENPLFVTGLEAAIESLDARGLIDPDRVGLIGWSREGMHVHYAVAFSKLKYAAAIVSDSITATPMSYLFAYGSPRPGMLEWESNPAIIGAPLWSDGIDVWLQRSPFFHLDRVRTPLRLEAIGLSVPALWETFATLKRHRRPVELIHIPDDSHVLQTPWGRLASQEGTVDWFAFWLRDEVDAQPHKTQQYRYWRQLRGQLNASVPALAKTSP